jgi:hypothetical protein
MRDDTPTGFDESPTVEVIVFRDGNEIRRELCESAEQAAAVVDAWSEHEDVHCQVDDLAVHHTPDQILEPTADVFVNDEYEPEAGA